MTNPNAPQVAQCPAAARAELRRLISPRFDVGAAQAAADRWGFNCGPASVAAVCGLTPDELRPHLGDFERKRYTNPRLMYGILDALRVLYRHAPKGTRWPAYGLTRVQWDGPWCAPTRPNIARQRYTHWVGVRWGGQEIFDVNAIAAGGWLSISEWRGQLVPWLLRECPELKAATGGWWPTHNLEITLPELIAPGIEFRQFAPVAPGNAP